MIIGAQFYTIRDFCQTPAELAESLTKIADIGYTTVQISGTCAYDPDWLKKELDKNGLQCVVTHNSPDKFADTKQICADHEILNCRNIGLGYFNFAQEDRAGAYKTFLDTYLPVAKQIRENGRYFMYHNHDGEFAKLDGKIILERIAEDFSPEELGIIVDTFWVQAGGGDPAQWIERLSGRVPCIHLKDFAYGKTMAVIGEGNINFDRVLEKAESAGTQYLLVEQDNCNGENPFDCLKRSYKYLTSLGLK